MDYFYRKVDTRSRKSMTEFLAEHARYDTMNSWNRATSYAHCVKVHRLGLTSAECAKAYEVLLADEVSDAWQPIVDDFTDDWNGCATIGFNGRSGGYLVLYESEYQDSGYRSYCSDCGQQNYQSVTATSRHCGRCGAASRVNYVVTPRKLVVWSGRGMDESRDFSAWPLPLLRERVRLVQAFDRACDQIRDNFIDIVRSFDVVDAEFSVVRTRKVLVERATAA
jgi:hypothetical protein